MFVAMLDCVELVLITYLNTKTGDLTCTLFIVGSLAYNMCLLGRSFFVLYFILPAIVKVNEAGRLLAKLACLNDSECESHDIIQDLQDHRGTSIQQPEVPLGFGLGQSEMQDGDTRCGRFKSQSDTREEEDEGGTKNVSSPIITRILLRPDLQYCKENKQRLNDRLKILFTHTEHPIAFRIFGGIVLTREIILAQLLSFVLALVIRLIYVIA